jgi:regulatory protein
MVTERRLPGSLHSGGQRVADRTAYDQALTLLGFRARSVSEMRRRLLKAGQPNDDVDATIERLLSQRLLDDDDFARQFARTRLLAAGTSRRRIVQELARKGVARDVAERAVEDVRETEGVDVASSARNVARKKWNALASLDELTRKRRVYAFLARRGFDPDEIREVMSAIASEMAE